MNLLLTHRDRTFPSSLFTVLAALTFYHAKSACDHQKSLNNCSPGQYLSFDKCDLLSEGYVSGECSESLLQKCDISFYPGAAYCNTSIYYSYLEIKAMTSS